MSEKPQQSAADTRRAAALLRLLRGKGWGHCELATQMSPRLQAQATMKYELGADQAPVPITITFRPREAGTHIAGFVVVRVELPDGRCLYGDLMPSSWLGEDLTAIEFCAGVAKLPRPEA